ncbi:MAG: DNA gyrase subunit B [Lactobacillales bacterium]|jgi:DNA gyrase subunit B|nr:DNA gyrase subunit B [Lactobacillales bacterium]
MTNKDATIRELNDIEAVRLRPGMYIGATDSRGLHHMVWEIVDNSIDEALAGYANEINLTVEKDNSITVVDNGRGIPVEKLESGKSALEAVFTVLHAGGKFDNEGYKYSGGLHGVGASVTNFLSEELDVTVKKDGKIYRQAYKRGVPTSELQILGETTETGTTVHFKPDSEIFKDQEEIADENFNTEIKEFAIEFDTRILETRIQQLSYLNRGLKLTLRDNRESDYYKEFVSDDGIKSYITDLNHDKAVIFDDPIYVAGEEDDKNAGLIKVEIALQYSKDLDTKMLAFTNNVINSKGGKHVEGFNRALTRAINNYGRNSGIVKEKDENFKGEDVQKGLTAVISLKHPDPQFTSQTKDELSSKEVSGIVSRIFDKEITKYLMESPATGKEIVKQAQNAQKARKQMQKTIEEFIAPRKDALGISSLPGKLADCSSNKASECELFVVEGDSAGGSAKSGRDRNTQAILPIRGKILNVEKASIQKILANQEIRSLFTAMGTGFGSEFDVTKARYHKLVIMTDADVDGAHISTLLLTLFYRHFKPLVEAGYVYIAQPPIYGVKQGRSITYVQPGMIEGKDPEQRLAETIESLPQIPKPSVQRYKGLGEMDEEQLWETTMDPARRVMKRVTVDDAELANATFEMLMGDEVEPRRKFIEDNAVYVKNLDI